MSNLPGARNRYLETSIGFSIAQQILVLVGAAGAHEFGFVWPTVAMAAAIYWIGLAIILLCWGRYSPWLGQIFVAWGFLIVWVPIFISAMTMGF